MNDLDMALLNITNFDDHPEQPLWMVFRFADHRQCAEFVAGLQAENLPHEQDANGGPPFLVGVKQRDREAAVRINYTVLGRYREPFIGNVALRWALLILVGGILLLALVGIVLQK